MGRREKRTEDRGMKRMRQEEIRVLPPTTQTHTPLPCLPWPGTHKPPGPARSAARQSLTRIWFRSCSASCLSCSSSLMAPGPWGGVGGGWGPRDGGWGRQLLAVGPRPGGCRADVRPKAAGEAGVKAGPKRGPEGVSTGGREGEGRQQWPRFPGAEPGSLARRDVAVTQATADFPNLPPAPRKRSEKCKRKRKGNPSLGQQPGRDTRGRNWGAGGGGVPGRVPSKTDPASAPAAQAPPS